MWEKLESNSILCLIVDFAGKLRLVSFTSKNGSLAEKIILVLKLLRCASEALALEMLFWLQFQRRNIVIFIGFRKVSIIVLDIGWRLAIFELTLGINLADLQQKIVAPGRLLERLFQHL